MAPSLNALVTGSTGLVGSSIVHALVAAGEYRIRLLVRDRAKAEKNVIARYAAQKDVLFDIVEGDITVAASLQRAVDGQHVIYHAAGIPEHWNPDPDAFRRVNVEGTRLLMEAALAHNSAVREGGRGVPVERIIFTSTMDTLKFSVDQPFDESELVPAGTAMATPYQQSKVDAQCLVQSYAARLSDGGIRTAHIHPAAVFGPGSLATPTMNQFFVDVAAGAIPMLLAGGYSMVYSDDCGAMHVAAERKLRNGAIQNDAHFLCAESYHSLADIVATMRRHEPAIQQPPVMPYVVAKGVSVLGGWVSCVTGKPPLIPASVLYGLTHQGRPNYGKAAEQLEWRPLPFDDAVRNTIEWLRSQGLVKLPPAHDSK